MAKKKAKAIQVTVARLDADGVYQGVDTIVQTDLNDEHVQVPADCDLVPGKYKWVANPGTFMPLLAINQGNKKERVS